MENIKRDLIKKHLEFSNGDFFHASVKSYEITGRASGSFFMALKAMMDEYAEQLALHNVVGQGEQLGEEKIRCNSCNKVVDKDYCSFLNCRLKA